MSAAAPPALSVLDLVPVRTDQSSGDAVAATLALARVADERGYRRYWLAEHHNITGSTSASDGRRAPTR